MTSNQNLPLGTRRAFMRVLSAIKTVALFHQHQRSRDERNRVIAEMSDYFLAYQLIDDSFRESLGEGKSLTDPRVKVIEKMGPISMKDLAKVEKVSVPSLTEWVNLRSPRGLIVWCDEGGNEFPDRVTLDKAKHSGKAFIKVGYHCGLPAPFELTGDARWQEGGELYEMFDLKLGARKKAQDPVLVETDQESEVSEPENGNAGTDRVLPSEGDRVLGQERGGVEKEIPFEGPAIPLFSAANDEEALFMQFSKVLRRPDVN